MCGIVGVIARSPVNQLIYDALLLLQHRGQDSTGIATDENGTFHMAKVKGQVREAYRTRDMRTRLGNTGLGHVRYATRGLGNGWLLPAGPLREPWPRPVDLVQTGIATVAT